MSVESGQLSIQTIATFIGALASISLIASGVYEYSYISGLGLEHSSVPISFSDIYIQSFTWGKYVLFGLIGLAAGDAIHDDAASTKAAREFKERGFSFRNIFNPIVFPFAAAIYCLVIYVIYGDERHFYLVLGVSVFITGALAKIIHANGLDKLISRFMRYAILLSVFFLGFLYAAGYRSGSDALESAANDVVYFEKGESIKANVVRGYSQGIIMIKAKTVTFVSKDEYKRIRYSVKKTERVGIPCYLFDVLCEG